MFSSQQSQVSSDTLYVEDVFSAFVRTGTGASATVTTGLGLSGGGLIISKGRSGATDWAWYDTGRGVTKDLVSNSTAAETTQAQGLTTISSTGHTWGTLAKVNTNGATYVDLCWKKAPKFFDVVTYTGTGVARTLSHSLGQAPGMILVKCTSTTGNWAVYHRANTANPETDYLLLNTTAATADLDTYWNDTAPTSAVFSVGTHADVNTNGATYVAYLFAHDPSATGLIQCGSFTTDGSGNATVNLGWEPQFLLLKTTSAANNWTLFDTARGMTAGGGAGAWNHLYPNLSNAAADAGVGLPNGTNSTGFSYGANASTTHIYLAIRRGPMKAPTSGTQVYNAIARTGDGGSTASITGVGFPPDLLIAKVRDATHNSVIFDRLRGPLIRLNPTATDAEGSLAGTVTAFGMDGVAIGDSGGSTYDINYSPKTYINHFFRRYPGVFDQVCYTGTGVAKTEAHNLGVVPELIIFKARSLGSEGWRTGVPAVFGVNTGLLLNSTAATDSSSWGSSSPTATALNLGTVSSVNGSGSTYVAYLFATLAGISKVGSYTGTGTTLQIACGFAAGARFILIKRTDSTGDWYVWDSVRGIIAANDPFLLLNSTAAENTATDYIDPLAAGFEISSTAPAAINASGGTFIYLAFA